MRILNDSCFVHVYLSTGTGFLAGLRPRFFLCCALFFVLRFPMRRDEGARMTRQKLLRMTAIGGLWGARHNPGICFAGV